MKRIFLLLTLSLSSIVFHLSSANAQVHISIDANNRGPKVSPVLYGIFYEDINHAADGGIYAELIRNRSFEDLDDSHNRNFADARRNPRRMSAIEAWNEVGDATFRIIKENLLNTAQSNALNVKINKSGDGLQNEGFWGINAVNGREYRLSFWAKADKSYKGTLTASVQSADASSKSSVNIPVKLSKKWTKQTAVIHATFNDPKSVFTLTADKPGEFQIDVISLFPPTYKNRENGMRTDLATMLEQMHPRFMRFPGGCFVEGSHSPDNAFRWKRTIGPIENRPGHKNINWGYRTSDGLGFHEYLQLAEDLGAKPLYVCNVGIWHGGCTPLDSVQCWVDECMDALEYANGPVTSKYGKMRAENGHPAPFNIEYVEIGNENYNYQFSNNSDQSDHYPERYYKFYQAIKAKYPNIKCIGNVESWGTDDPSWRNSYPVDMLDEHYYRSPKWFADRFHKYDSYDRNGPHIYVGEYAVTQRFGNIGNLNAALGEAVYMMGIENNSDIVSMASYAPIFVNENDARWRPDMIRFNSEKSMGTPSYYVQKLMADNIGTQVLHTYCEYSLPQENITEDATPVHVGMASWSTNIHIKNPRVIIDGKEHKLGDFSSWKLLDGKWNIEDSKLHQVSESAQPAFAFSPFDITAKKYTYKVSCMKESGAEGFMPMVQVRNRDNYVWFNIGGWGNTKNNVEQAEGGGKSNIGKDRTYKVETGKWYDITINVDGRHITFYINDLLNQEVTLEDHRMTGVYASSTIDDETGEMIIKIVNSGWGSVPGEISLSNFTPRSATLTRLSSTSGDDENTLSSPRSIVPQSGDVSVSGNLLRFDVPSYSLNIIRVKQ